MTYEKFATKIVETENIQREDVKKFAIRFAFSFASFAIVVSYFCYLMLPSLLAPFIGLAFVLLFIFMFDYMAEDSKIFNMARKVTKRWYLLSILCIILAVVITVFCR